MKAQLPEDCKGIEFEFVKNVSGALMRPTLASGVMVNGNILLKSIASTGAVYVRLLVEHDLEGDSGIQRSLDDFMSEANQETHVQITNAQTNNFKNKLMIHLSIHFALSAYKKVCIKLESCS